MKKMSVKTLGGGGDLDSSYHVERKQTLDGILTKGLET